MNYDGKYCFKMVGVCFWFFNLIFVISLCFAKPKECPAVCSCLGMYVDCSGKKLDSIPSDLPKWVTHLDLENNAIKKLSGINWRHFNKLTEIKLNKNSITSIPDDILQDQTQLKILELNRNKIKEIKALTFKNLKHLTTLKLKRNHISELKDGAFYGLKSIDKLVLDYNSLRVISKSWLYGLEALQELSLNHNFIQRIENDSWEFCQTLSSLDLSFNKMESVHGQTFAGLEHLEKLFLSNNQISYIEEKAFSHLPNLRVLHLNNNRIGWTIEDANNGVFHGLNELMRFHLAGNKIKVINADAFIDLRSLTHLNLSNNNITSIQKNAFLCLPNLKNLSMNTSSLLCDCNLKWFIEWLKLTELKVQTLVCSYPDWLRTQSLLTVESNLTCDELPKPRLIEEPDLAIMALKGENVTLNCKAMSSSSELMSIVWKKDMVELINQSIVVTSKVDKDGKSTETSSTLDLKNVDNSYAGKYQCVASNRYGTTYSQKSTISVLVYPTFVKIPKNVTVVAGQTVKWECAANGEPPPEMAWHKDGGNDFPAARERRMQLRPNNDVFFIVNTTPSDMGVYSCTAHNAAGTVVANASLTVQEKPSFVKPMVDNQFPAGEPVVLQCLAKGNPKPTISWFKNGKPIVPTDRHFFIHEDQLVMIVDSAETDSGLYRCYLNNSIGDVFGESRITVKTVNYSTGNMLGIIIISVVACAILTSIVWVVIIYKTRRRMRTTAVMQTEMQEFPDHTTRAREHLMPDDISEHSSCKDSGTGDSAKRSSDDLANKEFSLIMKGDSVLAINNSHAPLLHYPQSTNHDRISIGGGTPNSSVSEHALS